MRSDDFIRDCEKKLTHVFERIDNTAFVNQRRVLLAMQQAGVSARHFLPTTGYGYDDIGRDTLDRVFAEAFFCEDALVRTQIASGTHAIYLALDGLLRNNDTIVFASGEPYDTLMSAMKNENSFIARGVNSVYVPLTADDKIDVEGVKNKLETASNVRVVYVQRSRGYAWRNAILPEEMSTLFSYVHVNYPNAVTFVDNCYGEFTRENEPSCTGADILVGSLIKNPGGGIAPTGGYIAGKKEFIDIIQHRLTVPGMGREVGSCYSGYMQLYQGIFLAPHVTAQALKTAVLFAKVFEESGKVSLPCSDSERSDIVQSLRFDTPQELIAFCRCIQSVSPVDSFVSPEPWAMPGYEHDVIMAAGTFSQGASIELSADAPIVAPYTVYIQGALTYEHGRYAVISAYEALKDAQKNS